ncbi:unnamed protein product [[Actinomadura] parvosata subsp. kistnae]|nr:unnamed protein product [Actinomadura parvosata subsp. kistnae]
MPPGGRTCVSPPRPPAASNLRPCTRAGPCAVPTLTPVPAPAPVPALPAFPPLRSRLCPWGSHRVPPPRPPVASTLRPTPALVSGVGRKRCGNGRCATPVPHDAPNIPRGTGLFAGAVAVTGPGTVVGVVAGAGSAGGASFHGERHRRASHREHRYRAGPRGHHHRVGRCEHCRHIDGPGRRLRCVVR